MTIDPLSHFSRQELLRYARHLVLPHVGVEGQARLKAARVLVVGAGGLGSPVAMYLAAAGVGTLGLVDFDVVDASNLQRQLLHGESDVGRRKLDSASDTLREIKKIASFPSHKLNYLAKELFEEKKLPHEGFEMWKGCMRGEKKWWDVMKRYNRKDIVLLKKLYKKIAPWINGPNASAREGGLVCRNMDCRSTALVRRGVNRTRTRTYQRYQCQTCGCWMQATHADPTPRAEVK